MPRFIFFFEYLFHTTFHQKPKQHKDRNIDKYKKYCHILPRIAHVALPKIFCLTYAIFAVCPANAWTRKQLHGKVRSWLRTLISSLHLNRQRFLFLLESRLGKRKHIAICQKYQARPNLQIIVAPGHALPTRGSLLTHQNSPEINLSYLI